jgi:DNA-binding Lrp family transcriptional regulator
MARNKSNRIESTIAKLDKKNNNNKKYGVFDYSSPRQILKLLDRTNVKIISEVVNDPTISSLYLSKKLDVPLSTMQRRRAQLEKSILKRTYSLDYKAFGAREGDLIINVDKGKSKQVAQYLLKNYKDNITFVHTRINSSHNVSAHIVYKNTQELYELIESVKTIDYVTGVQWSETVELVGDNNSGVISGFFSKLK